MSDHFEIIKSVADGDPEAFRKLYGLFSERVYNTSLSYVQNAQDAEEITQDVFTSIFRNATKFKGDSALSTWIYRITVNTSLNFIKRNKRLAFLKFGQSEQDRPAFDHPGVLLERKEDARALFEAIESLAGNQKTAIILSFVEDLPRKEVAEIMELSLKAVESLLQRAKKNLKVNLGKRYPGRRKKR